MQLTEERILERRLVSRFRKALSNYNLVNDDDRVLVALSGGKDSLCLLQLLARQSQVYRPKFHVEAVHVRMDNIEYETDTSYLSTFCQDLHVPLHVLNTRFDTDSPGINTPSQSANPPQPKTASILHKQKTPCFLCSWYRRKAIFDFAQQHGFNKIALGHHQDDILHTALMNLCFQGRFDSMPPLLRMRKMNLTLIRPLCLEHEADILAFARTHQYQKQRKLCPYEHETHRTDISQLYEQIEQLNPEARFSIWHALEKDRTATDY